MGHILGAIFHLTSVKIPLTSNGGFFIEIPNK